ncbi:putative acid phosphatase precursor [Danaus plexippus plexippus]|uniref:Acid phosphatase n=1 Tax=Danaus plexippus plexippus TaxID=278856 RepID=A0A212FKJ8_DANPL|nr:putative acid phosphatase precursor [Danaus plexippus plexippus]
MHAIIALTISPDPVAAQSSFSESLPQLVDCHNRIEISVMYVLQRAHTPGDRLRGLPGGKRSLQTVSAAIMRHFPDDPAPWTAFRSQDYGYTRLKVYNKTHVHIEQVSVDLNGQVIDAFWLIKTNDTTFL